jgi:hypothetical protein
MNGLHAQQGVEEYPRCACVTASRLQPRNAQSLVCNVAPASFDMLFDLVEVPSKYARIHVHIVGRVAGDFHAASLEFARCPRRYIRSAPQPRGAITKTADRLVIANQQTCNERTPFSNAPLHVSCGVGLGLAVRFEAFAAMQDAIRRWRHRVRR